LTNTKIDTLVDYV